MIFQEFLIYFQYFSSVDTADIWFPTPPATPNLSLRPSSRTASIHSVSSRPSSVASYYSFHRNNNGAPSVQQEELTFKQQQRASVWKEFLILMVKFQF